MKKLAIFLVFVIQTAMIFAQDNNSVKREILEEITTLIDNSNLEINEKLNHINEEIRLIKKDLDKRYSNDAINDLLISTKSESKENADELIEGKIEKLLNEVAQMIIQSNKNLSDDILQTIEQFKTKISEETQELIGESKEALTKTNNEVIDNKSSELYLAVTERITEENKVLQQKLEEQDITISELKRRIEELEIFLKNQDIK